MRPHHGLLCELSEDQCIDLIKLKNFCHLGCYDSGEVYVVPISYIYDSGVVYLHSRPGKKLEFLSENNRGCIQVEEIEDFTHWSSVLAWGEFEELKGYKADLAMQLILKSMGAVFDPLIELELLAHIHTGIVYKLRIDKVSGKTEGWSDPKFKNDQLSIL